MVFGKISIFDVMKLIFKHYYLPKSIYRMDCQCCPVETPRGNPPGGFHLKMGETPHSLAIMTLGLNVGGFHLSEVETPHLSC